MPSERYPQPSGGKSTQSLPRAFSTLSLRGSSASSSRDSTSTGSSGKNVFLGFLTRVFGKKSRSLCELPADINEEFSRGSLDERVRTSNLGSPRVLAKSRSVKNLRSAPASPSPTPSSPTTQRRSPRPPRSQLKHARSEPALKYMAQPAPSTMPEPLPTQTSRRLVDVEPGGRLRVNRESLRYLQGLEAHVVVLAAAGTPGVGRSSVLNRLARKDRLFGNPGSHKDGMTPSLSMAVVEPWWTDAETAGRPAKKRTRMVLLDTLGFTGEASVMPSETRLITLVLLIASSLILVGRRRMATPDLAKLSCLGDFPGMIDPATTLDALAVTLPNIAWVILDADEPTGTDDPKILEDLLHTHTKLPTPDATPHPADRVRGVLVNLFTKQSLFSIPAPPSDEDQEIRPVSSVDPEMYRRRNDALSSHVARTAGVKQIAGGGPGGEDCVALRARDWACLLTVCCDLLNDSVTVLPVVDIWRQVLESRTDHLHACAKRKYDDFMNAIAVPSMPLDLPTLRERHNECSQKAVAATRDLLDDGPSAWRAAEPGVWNLLGAMDDRGKVEPSDALLVAFVVKNFEVAIAKCQEVLIAGQEQIAKKIADRSYDAISLFDQDMSRILTQFHRSTRTPSLLSPALISHHLQPFTTHIAQQRSHLAHALAERAHHLAARTERDRLAREEQERRFRDHHMVLRAADELRDVQDMIATTRMRQQEEERLMRESERWARERLAVALSGGNGDPAARTADDAGRRQRQRSLPRPGGMVGAPPHSMSAPSEESVTSAVGRGKARGRSKSNGGLTPIDTHRSMSSSNHHHNASAFFPTSSSSSSSPSPATAPSPRRSKSRSKSLGRSRSHHQLQSPAQPHHPHFQYHQPYANLPASMSWTGDWGSYHPSQSQPPQQPPPTSWAYQQYPQQQYHPGFQHQLPPVPTIPTIYAGAAQLPASPGSEAASHQYPGSLVMPSWQTPIAMGDGARGSPGGDGGGGRDRDRGRGSESGFGSR
ncbi:Guanylate-binding protein 6 [Thoreauomyces humboldtii]|nr:Guanylate-binding protein 6 [Thoreauomyces humboldtii]